MEPPTRALHSSGESPTLGNVAGDISGELRLSSILPWQSAHREFYFTDVFWPALRELDFLRALRTFQQPQRRFGL
jgi:undecaprenyl diphosphate synthase